MNQLPFEKQQMISELMQQSFSVRATAKMLSVNRNTVLRYRKMLHAEELLCGCGKPLKHRGWCSIRYERSLNRQKFVKTRWHGKPPETLEEIRQALVRARENPPCYFGE